MESDRYARALLRGGSTHAKTATVHMASTSVAKSEAQRLQTVVDALDLTTLASNLRRHLGDDEDKVGGLIAEYRKFLVLKALAEDWDGNKLTPWGDVDTAWTLHILETDQYAKDCEAAFGRVLHRRGEDPFIDDEFETLSRKLYTRAAYVGTFRKDIEEEAAARGAPAAGDSSEQEVMLVSVKTLTGATHHFHVLTTATGMEVKLRLLDKEAIPVDQQRLVFAGKQVENRRTLATYGVTNESTLHLILRLRGC